MNLSEAQEVFINKRNEVMEELYTEIKKASAEGHGSLIFYPSTESLLKSIMKELKKQDYWVKEIKDEIVYSLEQVKEMNEEGKTFCYYKIATGHIISYYRRGLKIWWKKPGFWEWHL